MKNPDGRVHIQGLGWVPRARVMGSGAIMGTPDSIFDVTPDTRGIKTPDKRKKTDKILRPHLDALLRYSEQRRKGFKGAKH